MTNLNVNDLKEFKEQPTEYNTEEELIDWLKWDLYQQALRNGKIPNENNIITITDEEEKNYTLNIGNDQKTILINFHFDLIKITNKSTVEFKIYFGILIFKFDVFIKNFIFNNEIIFVGTYFNNKLIFERIIFNNSLSFNSIKINNELHLHYVIFKKRVNFLNITFYYKISFYKINTYDDIFFNIVSFYTMFSLIDSTFNGELNCECNYHVGKLYYKNNIFYKKFNFRKSTFHSLMDFELFNNTFENIVDFSNIETEKDIKLYRIKVSKSTKIILDNINLKKSNIYRFELRKNKYFIIKKY